LHHQDPASLALHAETAELLRRAFGTARRPVIFPGEAAAGLEAAAASLIAPGGPGRSARIPYRALNPKISEREAT